jgi:Arc/MetJ-type ribon-helix-helix transcriptional regulator
MKHQISITIEKEILVRAKEKLREGLFRNKSHLFEYSLKKYLEDN